MTDLRCFAFELALACGIPNVDEMLAGLPLPLLFEWMEFAAKHPFGDRRADLRSAIVAREIRMSTGAKRVAIDDFLPRFGEKPERQTDKQMQTIWNTYMSGVRGSRPGGKRLA